MAPTERLIAIDPGRDMGIALFQNDFLVQAGLLQAPNLRMMTKGLFRLCDEFQPTRGIIEIPRIYPYRRQPGDPNHLITLSLRAGIAIAAISPFTEAKTIHPQKWKGQRPKSADNRYVLSILNSEELGVVQKCGVPSSKQHNVLDAIGIGLWATGRRN